MTIWEVIVGMFVAVLGGIATMFYRLYNKTGVLDKRVAILEDKDLEAQVKDLTREVRDFRRDVKDSNERNFNMLWEKMENLRIEIKGDVATKADKE